MIERRVLSSDPAALFWQGRCQAELGDHAAAIRLYDRVLERPGRFENQVNALMARGQTHRENGDLDRARSDYLRAYGLLSAQDPVSAATADVAAILGRIAAERGRD